MSAEEASILKGKILNMVRVELDNGVFKVGDGCSKDKVKDICSQSFILAPLMKTTM
jgi:hypothetical protein